MKDCLRNHALIKSINRAQILNTIRLGSPIARSQVADKTGLDRKSLTNFVNEFIAEGLVEETGTAQQKGKGRPFTMLEFKKHLVMGLEITSGSVGGVMMDFYGKVHFSHRIRDENMNTRSDKLLSAVKSVYQRLKSSSGEVYRGVGVSVQGVVEPGKGTVLEAFNIPSAVMDLKSALGKFMSEPVYVENSSMVGALAEKWFGTGSSSDDFIYVELGGGIGAGIVSRRRLYRGTGMHAGELGHTVVERNGILCRCGSRGCLEAYASEGRILSELRRLHSVRTESLEELAELPAAKTEKILKDAGTKIGWGIGNLINLFNPNLIVLGGRMVDVFGDILVPAISKAAAASSLKICMRDASIVASKTPDPIACGAAALILSKIFEVEDFYYI
ncbi:MAG: ROK family protein [Victivallales bacterium]